MRRSDFGNQDQPQDDFRQGADQVNRKLIRPNLSELKDRLQPRQPRRKQVPPESTNAEAVPDAELAAAGSEVRVAAIRAQEDVVVARAVRSYVSG